MIKPSYACVQNLYPLVRFWDMWNGAAFIEEFTTTADHCLTLDKNGLEGHFMTNLVLAKTLSTERL